MIVADPAVPRFSRRHLVASSVWPRRGRADPPLGYLRRLMLAVSVLAMCALVQFPFTAPVYFTYVAPLLFVAVVALVAGPGRRPAPVYAVLVGFYLLFALFRVTPSFIHNMGVRYAPDEQIHKLMAGRADLNVTAADAAEYTRLVAEVRARARGGFMYAAPDSPEVYF